MLLAVPRSIPTPDPTCSLSFRQDPVRLCRCLVWLRERHTTHAYGTCTHMPQHGSYATTRRTDARERCTKHAAMARASQMQRATARARKSQCQRKRKEGERKQRERTRRREEGREKGPKERATGRTAHATVSARGKGGGERNKKDREPERRKRPCRSDLDLRVHKDAQVAL